MTSEKLTRWALEMRKEHRNAGSHIGVAAMFLKWFAWRDTHPEWLGMDNMIPDHLRSLCTMRQRTRHRKEVPVLTPQQVRSLIQACRYTHNPMRNRSLIAMLWDTGFRIGELLNMKNRHIYRRADRRGVLRWFAECPVSKTKPRKVVLCESIPIIRESVKNREPDTPLWVNKNGNPLRYSSWRICLEGIIRNATRIDPMIKFPEGKKSHLFRHSRATYLANNGWNESMLLKHFGWSSMEMAAHYVEEAGIDTGAAFDQLKSIELIPTKTVDSEPRKKSDNNQQNKKRTRKWLGLIPSWSLRT
jgi:integrase